MKTKIKKTIAAALVATTVGAGSLAVTAQPASAAINVGALYTCLMNPHGEIHQDTEDGSIWCVYYDGLFIDQIA